MKIIIELDDSEMGRPLDPEIVRNRANMIAEYLNKDENIKNMTEMSIIEDEVFNQTVKY